MPAESHTYTHTRAHAAAVNPLLPALQSLAFVYFYEFFLFSFVYAAFFFLFILLAYFYGRHAGPCSGLYGSMSGPGNLLNVVSAFTRRRQTIKLLK